jgi:hypothetical protein
MSGDLFGHTPTPPIGMTVRLVGARNDHRHDRCGDLATVEPGKAMHAAALKCVGCGGFRGWLRHLEFDWLGAVAAKLGVTEEPIILRNWNTTTGDDVMTDEKKYDNSGILFRNDDKREGDSRDRDYKGEATINGVGYWMSGWIKEGKKGKFMTFSFKPKDAAKPASTRPAGADFNDEVPF